MNNEQAALMIHGRQYREELTREEEQQLREAGLVAVFGASDDLLEFRGAIDEELGAWDGTTAYLVKKKGEWVAISEDDFEEYKEKLLELGYSLVYYSITAEWSPEEDGESIMSWRITSEIPNAKFFIVEDDDNYCQGLVFSISDM